MTPVRAVQEHLAAFDDQVALHLERLWEGVAQGPDAAALRAALDDAVSGGKRFRPRLLAAVHASLGGSRDDATVAQTAAAVELLHTAFVVHDDVIDADDVRRGRASVPGRFRSAALRKGVTASRAATYALAGGVLTGDLALSAAFRAIATLPESAEIRTQVLDLVTRASSASAAGELTDVRLSLGVDRPTTDAALALAEGKTAAYSFVLPMELGATLAGAEADVVAAVREAGRLLGIAFQLYDDLAGVFGDPAETGKSNLADLREGKSTLMIVHARQTSSWPFMEAAWGDAALTEERAAAVRAVLERCGSRAYVEAVASEHLEAGIAQARSAGLTVDVLEWLVTLPARPAVGAA
ncbi:polyprenyl synthetase family protein [Mumia sp. Pv 4-285]|uniref:polyprenyl synthetase family protein n=1 Tax=Mumia qirimensis TaxID=3234852 RepID=UPI00351D8E8F